MNTVLHLAKKDCCRFWIPLVLWGVVLFLQIAFKDYGATWYTIHTVLAITLSFATFSMIFILVPMLIHQTPPWGVADCSMMRPISPELLMSAKSLFLLIFLVICPCFVKLTLMAQHGVVFHDLLLATPEILLSSIEWLVPVFALATITRNYWTFLVCLIIYLAVFALHEVMTNPTHFFNLVVCECNHRIEFEGERQLIKQMVIFFAGLACVYHQYKTQRTLRTAILIGFCMISSTVAEHTWRWPFLPEHKSTVEEKKGWKSQTPSEVAVQHTLTYGKLPVVGSPSSFLQKKVCDHSIYGRSLAGPKNPEKGVSILFTVQANNPAQVIQVTPNNVQYFYSNGYSIGLGGLAQKCPCLKNEPFIQTNAIEKLFGGSRVVGEGSRVYPYFTDREIAQIIKDYRGYAPDKISANLKLEFFHYEIEVEIPLREGELFPLQSERIEIAEILKNDGGVNVILRNTRPKILLAGSKQNSEIDSFFVIYHPEQREVILGSSVKKLNYSPVECLLFETQNLSFIPSDQIFPELSDEWLHNAKLARIKIVKDAQADYSYLKLVGSRSEPVGRINIPLTTNESEQADICAGIALLGVDRKMRTFEIYRRAEACFTRAIKEVPDNEAGWSRRCEARVGLRDYAGAIADAGEALKLKPYYWHSLMFRGQAYHGLGLYEKALEDYEAILKNRPDSLYTLELQAYSYLASGRGDEAVRSLEKSWNKHAKPHLKHRIGLAYLVAGMSVKAVKAFQGLNGLWSEHGQCVAEYLSGNLSEARKRLKKWLSFKFAVKKG